jgi:hypothetical protein
MIAVTSALSAFVWIDSQAGGRICHLLELLFPSFFCAPRQLPSDASKLFIISNLCYTNYRLNFVSIIRKNQPISQVQDRNGLWKLGFAGLKSSIGLIYTIPSGRLFCSLNPLVERGREENESRKLGSP